MRKGLIMLLLVLISACSIVLAYAASTSNVTVSAQVPNNGSDMSVTIKQLNTPGQDPSSGTTVTAMNFGTLTHTLQDNSEAGVWYSPNYFCVFVYTTSYGKKYQIQSTCTGLSNGSASLPSGSFGISPAYAAADAWSINGTLTPQGAQPSGSVLGSTGSAILSNKLVYQSEAEASNRIIRAFYSLPGYLAGGALPFAGYSPIPLTQAPGTYSGTATISIVAY